MLLRSQDALTWEWSWQHLIFFNRKSFAIHKSGMSSHHVQELDVGHNRQGLVCPWAEYDACFPKLEDAPKPLKVRG